MRKKKKITTKKKGVTSQVKSRELLGQGVYCRKIISFRFLIFAVMYLIFIFIIGLPDDAYGSEMTPTPTITEIPEEANPDRQETVFKDGVPDNYFSDVTTGLTNAVNGLVSDEEKTVSQVLRGSAFTFEKVIYYIPFIGIGIFLIGAFIAMFSIKNKANRRWGIRMAVVTSLVLFVAYILIIVLYDINFKGIRPEEVVRPLYLDHYGKVYFDVWEDVLEAEKLAGLADKMLSRNILAILVNFYKNSAFEVGGAIFGLGLLLTIITKKNVTLKKWAGVVLCIVVPVILYAGYWYVSRLG